MRSASSANGRLRNSGQSVTRTSASASSASSCAFETTVRVWETSTRLPVGAFQGQRRHVSALAFSPDGRTLASAGADGAILFWDLTGQRQEETQNH